MSSKILWALAVLALTGLGWAVPTASALEIDDFSISDEPIIDSGSRGFAASNSIGGGINIELERLAGTSTTRVAFNATAGLTFDVNNGGDTLLDVGGDDSRSVGGDTRGRATLTWDGDVNPAVFAPEGLGGVDLTADGSALKLTVGESTAGMEAIMEVYTDAGNASTSYRILPGVTTDTDFLFPYSTFSTLLGGGADFSDVGAIRLILQATEPRSVRVSLLETAAPAVEATMVDLRTDDTDIGAGTVGPGDQLKYRITVTNTGGDALGLSLEIDPGVDAGTTVASVETQPVGIDDNYQGFGNVTLSVPVATGVLSNDVDPDGDTPRVNIANSSTASSQGGTVGWNDIGAGLGDGAFTYSPPAGFRGLDTFTYEVTDDNSRVDTATVSVRVETTVWFVDNTDGGANQGTQADPFQSITPTNLNGAGGVGDVDGPGDIIYFFSGSGTYAGGLQLEDDQLVLGPEDGLTIDGQILIADNDDPRPTLTAAAGNGVTLAQDNEIRALTIGNTPAGVGLAGSNFGTLTASNVSITGTGGAVDLDNGTAAATFESLASTSGALGVDLDAVLGSFVVSGTTTLDGTAGTALNVVNGGGGVYNFGTTAIGQSAAVDAGVSLGLSPAATFDFTALSVTSDAGIALSLSTAGTVRVAGAGNSLAATNAGAIALVATAFDGAFTTVNASGGALDGIFIQGLTDATAPSPALTIGSAVLNDFDGSGIEIVQTDADIQVNGGTIGNVTEVGATDAAIFINGGSGDVTVAAAVSANATDRSVEVINRTGGTVSIDGSVTDTGQGVRLNGNGAGLVRFRGGMALNTGADTAFDASGGGIVAVCTSVDCGGGAAVANRIGNTTALTTTAISISGAMIGAENVTFTEVNVDQGSTTGDVPALVLTDTGSGQFAIEGTGTTAGSGGTIQNITDNDGIRLSNTGGRVTLANMVIEDIGDSSDAADAIGTRSVRDGIHGQAVTGGLTIRGTTMRRFSDMAIHGATFAGAGTTTWNGLEIIDSLIQDSNRYHIGPEGPAGLGDDNAEGMVRILGLSGTVLVQNSTLERGGQLLDFLTASSGTLAMTVQSSNFNRTLKEFLCAPPGTVNIGKAGISVRVTGSADLDLFVGDPAEADASLGNTFLDNATASIVVLHDTASATGEIDTIISRNTFRVLDHLTGPAGCPAGSFLFNTAQGGVFLGPGAGDFEGIVSNNLFDQVQNANGGIGQLSVTFDDGGDGELIVRGNNFQLPWDASVRLLADGNNSAAVLFGGPGAGQANTYTDGVVGGASDDLGGPSTSPFNPWSVNVRNGGRLDLKIDSEILPQHDDVFSAFPNSFDASINPTGGTLNLHITDSVSPDGYRFDIAAGTVNLFNEENVGGCPISAAQILDDNGNTGGGNSDATDPPTVVGGGGVTCSTTAPAAPSVMIP